MKLTSIAAALSLATGLGAGLVGSPATTTVDDPAKAALNRNVRQLDRSVTSLEKRVTPFVQESVTDGTTTLTLQSDILFDFGASTVTDSARAGVIAAVADIPQGAALTVEGHTDDIPYSRGNDVLSQERAQAVADVMAAERPDLVLSVSGHGESQPIADNRVGGEDNPEGRAQNRRVEIRYAR